MGRVATGRPPSPFGPPPLVLERVSKSYGAVRALVGLDLVVPRGSIVALIGPNGSGKTTAIHVAAGLVSVDTGSVRVAGLDPDCRPAREARALVPDDPAGFDELEVEELVALSHALWGAAGEAGSRARTLLSGFGFVPGCRRRLGELSRGRRRQAFVAAGASLAPALLLVDEATATLDPEAVVVLREALQSLARRGSGILLATQDLDFAAAVCDRLVILKRGAVVAEGSADGLCAEAGADSLEEAFLALCGVRGGSSGGLAAL